MSRIFSGESSESMWMAIKGAKTIDYLREALYQVCCRIQELETKLIPKEGGEMSEIGKPVSREEALRISKEIIEQAERERRLTAEAEATRGAVLPAEGPVKLFVDARIVKLEGELEKAEATIAAMRKALGKCDGLFGRIPVYSYSDEVFYRCNEGRAAIAAALASGAGKAHLERDKRRDEALVAIRDYVPVHGFYSEALSSMVEIAREALKEVGDG